MDSRPEKLHLRLILVFIALSFFLSVMLAVTAMAALGSPCPEFTSMCSCERGVSTINVEPKPRAEPKPHKGKKKKK